MNADSPGEVGAEQVDAARAALNRARGAARARGMLPGRPGVPRRPRVAGQPRSGSRPDARDPELLGASLGSLVDQRGWADPVAVGGVTGRWPQVVGTEVAEHCTPESFDAGVLVVRTVSTAWATQVRLLAPTLLRRLAEELGDGVVERVVVRGPAAPSWRRGIRAARGRGPRDTYG